MRQEVDGYVAGEIAPAKAPLSVAALTAPAAPEQPKAEPAYTVARDDEASDGVWDADAAEGSTDFAEPTQPPQ